MVPNGTLFGFYRALVISAEDPEKQGRVRIRIPDLMVDKGWGTGDWCTNGIWARPANNWVGGRNVYDTKGIRCSFKDAWYQGSCMIPPAGSHVFVFFEKGDPSHPYYFAAAEYGQTKVLPENRFGSQWWKKWTPFKSNEGRCIVFSDDPDDARVEITGKKRGMKTIESTPDGDTKTVFKIDNNMTTFLIDERPSHEKVFLKDYRGNYIKMIQDEEGVNDQLHVYFQDDIHLETLKNIYIKAGQNIHVTADQNIYITASENMYVNIAKFLKETAKEIHRYAFDNDYRMAGNNIHDYAQNDAARKAGNNIKDMAANTCSRNSMNVITDASKGNFSLQSGGTTSILGGGGVMIDGPNVSIENGSAPIDALDGIEIPTQAPHATEPKPDRYRYILDDPEDDGLGLKDVEDENPQYKCHNNFWKPNYVWDNITQSDNADVSAGSADNAKPEKRNIVDSPNNNQQEIDSDIIETISQTPPKQENTQKSFSDVIEQCLQDNEIPSEPEKAIEKSNEIVDNVSDTVIESYDNMVEETKEDVEEEKKLDLEELQKVVKNKISLLLQQNTSNLTKKLANNCVNSIKEYIHYPISESTKDTIKGLVTTSVNYYFYGPTAPRSSRALIVTLTPYQSDTCDTFTINRESYVGSICDDFNRFRDNKLDIKDIIFGFYDGFMAGYMSSIPYPSRESSNSLIDAILNSLFYNCFPFEMPFDMLSNQVCGDITPTFQTVNNDMMSCMNITDIIALQIQSTVVDSLVSVIASSMSSSYSQDYNSLSNQMNSDIMADDYMNMLSATNPFAILADSIIGILLDNIPTLDFGLSFVDMSNVESYSSDCCCNVMSPFDISKRFLDCFDSQMCPYGESNPELNILLSGINILDIIVDYNNLLTYDRDSNPSISHYLTSGVFVFVDTLMDFLGISLTNQLSSDLTFKNNYDLSPDPLISSVVSNLMSCVAQFILNVNSDRNDCVCDCLSPLTFSNTKYQSLSKSIMDTFLDSICDGVSTQLSKDIDFDYKSDILLKQSNCKTLIESLKDSIECKSDNSKLMTDLISSTDDVLSPIQNLAVYNDFVTKLFSSKVIPYLLASNAIDNKFSEKYLTDNINSNIKIKTIICDILDELKSVLKTHLQDCFIKDKKTVIDSIIEMISKKDPKDWNMDEILLYGKHIDELYSYFNELKDAKKFLELLKKTGGIDLIKDSLEDTLDSFVPTKESLSNNIKECIKETILALIDFIKQLISKNIVIGQNNEKNKFKNNIDLTGIYKIPGCISNNVSKNKVCEYCCDKNKDEDLNNESVWCDPEIVGGCGCLYEYTLFLKHKFYNTLIPIIYNDGIKTFGFSLNPNMECDYIKTNFEYLHDSDIKNDYFKLLDDIYNDRDIDDKNLYLTRIDEVMSTLDSLDITCVINLMDFENDNYIWLSKNNTLQNYTHDMIDKHYIKYITLLLRHIFYKNNERRSCRIVLNIGNKSYKNPMDSKNEIFNMYPNCGFIRDLIMKLAYELNISSNYMSITANKDNNLYYYNPYTQFKSYDDDQLHILTDYDICVRDCVDKVKNGMADIVTYDKDGNINGGYANYYIKCANKSYVMSYLYDLNEWLFKKIETDKTILDKYRDPITGEIDSNIMNEIYTPNARSVMRYFYKGHERFFQHKDLIFDPDSGEVEG